MIKFWILMILTCVIVYFGLKYIVNKIKGCIKSVKETKVGSYRIVRERFRTHTDYVIEVLNDKFEWELVQRYDNYYNAIKSKKKLESYIATQIEDEPIKREVIN